jgi:hypothetical protein
MIVYAIALTFVFGVLVGFALCIVIAVKADDRKEAKLTEHFDSTPREGENDSQLDRILDYSKS